MTVHVLSKRLVGRALILVLFVLLLATSSALAAGEPHPQVGLPFGSFSNPNGIAVDESTSDVFVADIETATVYKFDATGTPVNFSALASNALTGTATEAKSFSFPNVYGTPAAIAVDNACAQHRPALTGAACSEYDPSAGDLYVMDAGHGVIDKFNSEGTYLSQIAGFAPAPAGEHELLGLGVDANGVVHAELSNGVGTQKVVIEEFDGSAANHPIATRTNSDSYNGSGFPGGSSEGLQAHGFAVSPTGDNYPVYELPCGCTVKLGQRLSPLGRVDGGNAGDVSVAVDPATGHLYVDDQSSVAEWDTGAMNRDSFLVPESTEVEAAGVRVTTFGQSIISASSLAQGGIAVNGSTGEIYVSNPAGKDVYVFGSDAPGATTGAGSGVTEQAATLNGTVDPRGVPLTNCTFEYQIADEFGRVAEREGKYEHEAPCKQSLGEIGSGSGPVAVSADLTGLTAGELYRFRLVAANADGSSQSGGFLPTVGEGFAIKSFAQSFLNQDGTPDTQAGSHPFETVNHFTMKSHFLRVESNADSPYYRVSNGTLKDVAVDLPPGLVGDPNATPKKCTQQQLIQEAESNGEGCPPESLVGELVLHWGDGTPFGPGWESNVHNMVAPRGVAVQLGTNFVAPLLYVDNGLFAGGDYPIRATVISAPPAAPVLTSNLTVLGVVGEGANRKAFLTLPTGCHGPLRSTMYADSWQEPGHWVKMSYESSNAAGTPVSLTGCAKLRFPAEIGAVPDTTDASSSSGVTVHVKVPQTAALNVNGLAESALRDTTVTLPQGIAINPSGGGGLEACTSDPGALPKQGTLPGQETVLGTAGDQIGYKGQEEYEPEAKWDTFTSEKPNPLEPGSNFCPNGSKIATVKIKTPLLEHELEGSMYLAAQNANPFGSLIAMYLVAEDPYSGSLIKLAGEVKLSSTGQIVTTFDNTPDLPFEDLEIHFFGGERAPLTTPSRCGTYATKAVFTPWDGNGPVTSTSSFKIDRGPSGGPCPGAKLPFNPAFTGGSTNLQAGAFTPLTGTFSRQDGEQQMARLRFTLPPGLSGVLTGVKLCDEADANAGTCGAESLIGETTVAAGVGSDPITVSGGKVYLTGPYNGAPFGLSVVDPVKAGPFDLEHDTAKPATNMPACDCVVVRARLEIDPLTTAIAIVSNSEAEGFAIPHLIDGVPVELKKINFTTTRAGFQFNPTNCEKMAISGSEESDEGESRPVQVPFQVTNCAILGFKPSFKASVSGRTSRARGASLHVTLTYPKAPWGSQANIRSVKVNLPRQLPSRLTTLQKACPIKLFSANPASCPAASRVGFAKAITPILPVPLQGPAYFVSHGGAKFPELIVVLQGYGIAIDLHGETFINEKTNITSSTYRTVPDQPVTSFELTLPQGPNSALAANGNLCKPTKTVFVKRKVRVGSHGRTRTVTRRVRKTVPAKLVMPTAFTAQNGAIVHQNTPIGVSGCSKAKKTAGSKKRRKP